ncbi:MAG: hypothetical protein ACRDRX_17185 [Pseudonocardiaceae bacterium]
MFSSYIDQAWHALLATPDAYAQFSRDSCGQVVGHQASRVAVHRKDPQFLHETPHIAAQLAAAHDHGQHPLAHVPDLAGIPLRRAALRAPELYRQVNAWARAQIPPTTDRSPPITQRNKAYARPSTLPAVKPPF